MLEKTNEFSNFTSTSERRPIRREMDGGEDIQISVFQNFFKGIFIQHFSGFSDKILYC